MKKVIWIGPMVEPIDENKFKGISPAANKWQQSFIDALIQAKVEVVNLSYLPEPYFPKGKLIPFYSSKNSKIKVLQNRYINTPIFRDLSLAYNLISSSKAFADFDYVITYNNSYPHIKVAQLLQSSFKMKWINILADDVCCEGPDITVFLSYGYFQTSKQKLKYHFDGGIDQVYDLQSEVKSSSTKKKILFAGAINKWTGIEEFALNFSKLSHDKIKDLELHIYGKGDSQIINELVKTNDRIKFMGFVTKEELDIAMKECFAFINPRPLEIKGGEFNFPSKLLSYLAFGKPILSTHTTGIAPCYKDIIFFYNGSSEDLSANLIKINRLTDIEINELKMKIKFFVDNNLWAKKVNKFITFVDTIEK